MILIIREVILKYCTSIFLGFLILSGCSSPYYFDLKINPANNNHSFKSDKVLKVEDIKTNQIYWTSGIVIRSSKYKIKHCLFKLWAKNPGELIQDTILVYYRNNSLFKNVISDYSSLDPDIIMRIKIDAIEMCRIGKKWFARLALYFEISDQKKEKLLLTHSFDRKKEIKGKKPKYLPSRIAEILEEELLNLENKLKNLI